MTNEQIAELQDAANKAKATVETVQKAHAELDGRVNKLHTELAEAKTADAASKAAYQEAVARVEKAEKVNDEVKAEMAELLKRMTDGPSADVVKTFGATVLETKAAAGFSSGNRTLLETKATLSSLPASGGHLAPAQRNGVVMTPDLVPTVRQLFNALPTSNSGIEWILETFTNAAAVQAAQGDAYAESSLTYALQNSNVVTVGHFIPVTRQIIDDAPRLSGYIDTRLMKGLEEKIDAALLYGDGTGGNLLGMVPQATAFTATAGDTRIDSIRRAILEVAKARYSADFVVMSPADWAEIELQKTTDGAYMYGSPLAGAVPRLWGKRVVESLGFTAGNFLAGASNAATIHDRQQMAVRLAEQHADFAVKNMIALICDARLGFTVERPAAMVTGALLAA